MKTILISEQLNFEVIIGYDKNYHTPIQMNIKDILKEYPHIKTLKELDEILASNDNTLF